MEEHLQVPELLGTTVRNFRIKKGLTLLELADKTGLSSGFISKIERNLSKPSINNLQRICYALDIAIDDLAAAVKEQPKPDQENLDELNGKRLFISKSKRSLVYNLNNVIKLEAIFADSQHYKLEAMTLTGTEAEYVSSKHQYDEIGIVARGQLAITLNGKHEYFISEGDALLIPADTEHTIRKVSDEVCVSYWFKISGGGKIE